MSADDEPAPGSPPLDARDAMGLQIGSHNTQVNNFYVGYRTWAARPALPPLAGDSPYRGLGVFEASDVELFYGRDEAIVQVLQRMSRRLSEPGLLVVSGASGAGKSSLLRAGVLPRLRKDGLAGTPAAASWPCLLLAPGRSPLSELAAQVAPLAQIAASLLRRELAASPQDFALIARQAALAQRDAAANPAEGRLLLVIDQFEQVFTACPDERQRQAFITALHAASSTPEGTDWSSAALVVLGVRADFEARCAGYPELADAIQDRYLLTAMTSRQLRLAITGPAAQYGSSVDPALTETLLREISERRPAGTTGSAASPGVLPLLSHALDQAWRGREGVTLTLADYERTGGIESAVARSAQDAYDALTPAQQVASRELLTRMASVGPDGTETAVPLATASLTGGLDETRRADLAVVLEAFAARRLLTLTSDTVEITHEALLSAWPLLRDQWLAGSRADRIIRAGVRTAATEWDRHGQDPAYLYTGSLLEAADAVVARDDARPYPHLTSVERAFLTASRRAQQRRTRRRQALVAVLGALTLTLAATTGVAITQRDAANSERDIAASAALAAQSQVTGQTDPLTARLEAVAAWQLGHTPAAGAAMLQAAFLPWDAVLGNADSASGPEDSMAFSRDGTMLAVGTDSNIQLWSAATHQLLATLAPPGATSPVWSVAFSGDGRMLAAFAGTGIQLWDLATRTLVAQAGLSSTATEGQSYVAFSPNDALIAVSTVDGIRLLPVTHKETAGTPSLSGGVLLPGSQAGPLAFSPHGDLLAVDADATVQLWNVDGHQPTASLRASLRPPGNPGTYGAPAFSPDGATLAVSTFYDGIQLWRAATGTPLRRLPPTGTTSGVVSVAFSSTGRLLAAGTSSGSAQLWNIGSGTLVATLASGTGSPVSAVAFGRNGILAALTPGAVRLADITGILTIGSPSITLTAADTGTAVSVTFSHDGTLLAAGFSDGQVVVWNVARRTVLVRLRSAGGSALTGAVAFNPTSHMLAVGTKGGTVVLWGIDSPGVTATLRPPDGVGNMPIDSVAFSPHGDVLAGGTSKGSVLLWKVASRQPASPVQPGGNGDPAGSVAFSPSGQYLASSSGAGALLWDVTTRDLRAVLALLDKIGGVKSLGFSRDGKLLAVATNSGAQLWNLTATTPSITATVPGNASSVTFSPDGTVLAIRTGGDVTMWDADTSQLAGVLRASRANSAGGGPVALSPLIAAAADDGQIQLWDTPYIADPAAYLCDRVGQPFPPSTWTQLAQGVPYHRTC